MYKLNFKNNMILPIIIIIAGIILSVALAFIPISSVNIAIPLLKIEALAVFLILNLLIYPKASTMQVIVLSIVNVAIFLVMIAVAVLGFDLLGAKEPFLKHGLILSVSPISLGIGLLASIFAIYMSVKFEIKKIEKIIKEEPVLIEEVEKFKEETPILVEQPEEVIDQKIEEPELTSQVSPPVIEEVKEPEIKPEPQEEMFFEEISETEKIEIKPEISEIKEEPQQEEMFFEEIFETPQEPQVQEKVEYEDKTENIFEEELGGLPEINLEENQALKSQEPNDPQQDGQYQFIPENIRLVENPMPKEVESKGKIAAIGKLLVNKRDLENIIEVNALMQHIGGGTTGTRIITMISGEKTNEKFEKIKTDYPQVKDLVLLDKGGFVIASVIGDEHKEQTIGAIASGAFHTIQNYLIQLDITNPLKIFFETEDNIYSLIKMDDNILFSSCNKEFEPVDYILIKNILNQENISNHDLSVIRNIKGMIESVITDKEGKLAGSFNGKNPVKSASILSAIFENLKVFINHIQPSKLNKITTFTNDKVLVIKKYNDKIAGFLLITEGTIKYSDKIAKIEEFIRQGSK
ncbi:MAG: hypothetical protein V2B14_06185 [bacterium]